MRHSGEWHLPSKYDCEPWNQSGPLHAHAL